MIFKGTLDKVLDGTKTQTRRLVKDGDFLQGPIKLSKYSYSGKYVIRNNRTRFEAKKTYAVQPGRGKKSVGRIKIKSIHKEKLMHISITDCIAEGIETTQAEAEGAHVPEHRQRFAELWDSLYTDPSLKFNAVPPIYVWVLTFELVK